MRIVASLLFVCAATSLPAGEPTVHPPAYLKWHVWYMKYEADKKWVYIAGYLDPDEERVYYRWKGVRLQADQVPGIDRLTNRTPIYDITKLKGVKQVEIDPPVHYWLLKNGSYAVGYYDRSEFKFFRWRGIALQREELLPNETGHRPRVIPYPRLDDEGRPFTPEKENDYLLTIDPPAHLLERPERWKTKKVESKKDTDSDIRRDVLQAAY